MKKKLPYLLPSIVFFLGMPVIWLLCFREVPLAISPQTTHITEPRTPDGKRIDWFAAVKKRFEPKCDPKENGFRMLVEALGQSPYFDQPEWYWPELCKALDLDPTVVSGTMTFEPPDEFMKREFLLWMEDNDGRAQKILDDIKTKHKNASKWTDTELLTERLIEEPWTVEEFPFMKCWIEENKPFLDLYAEAVRKEYFFCPMLRESDRDVDYWPLPATLMYRDGMVAMRYLKQYHLGRRDVNAAWDCHMTDFCLSQSLARSHAFFRTSFLALSDFLADRTLTPENRQHMLTTLDALARPISSEKQIDYWRIHWLAQIDTEPVRPNQKTPYINWNGVAIYVNRTAEDLEQTLKKLDAEPDEDKKEQIIEQFKSRYKNAPPRGWLGDLLGKPVTVDARTRELAWSYCQYAMVREFPAVLLRQGEKDLQDLRRRLANESN